MTLALSPAYLRTEVLRAFRNPRYVLFTVVMPLVLFLVVGNAFDGRVGGVSAQTWYMVNMCTFGALGAVLSSGGRIAVERDAGWNRQLRLTPLTPAQYVVAKMATAMLVALPAVLLVAAAGLATGRVHLSVPQWAGLVGVTWVAMLPLAVVGVGIGYLARGDSAQAVTSAVLLVLSMFGGLWFPVDDGPQWLQHLSHAMPTYWTGQLSRAPITHHWPAATAYVVLAVWALVGGRVAAARYGRDDARAA